MSVGRAPGPGAERQSEEALYETCSRAAFLAALAVLHSHHDAEEVSLDACLVVFDRLKAGAEIANVKQYAHKVGFRLAMERKENRGPEIMELDDNFEVIHDPDAALRGVSIAWEACKLLSAAQRMALVLHDVQRYTAEEIAETMEISTPAAKQHLRRAREAMKAGIGELAAHRRGEPEECRGRSQLIWRAVFGLVGGEEMAELRGHMAACSYCRETWAEHVQARSVSALLLLFPLAATAIRKKRGLKLVGLLGAGDRRRIAIGGIAVILLILIADAGIPAWTELQPKLAAPVTAARLPSPVPSAVVLPSTPSPTQAPTAAASSTPTPTLSPSGAPPATSPAAAPPPPAAAGPPPIQGYSGPFAYMSGGELFYRSSPGAVPVQLSSTGGSVDNFWWQAGGQRLAYKTGNGTTLGNVYLTSPSGGQTLLASNVNAFSFSPDGSRFVTAAMAFASGALSGFNLTVASVGAPSAVQPYSVNAAALSQSIALQSIVESVQMPRAVSDPYSGVFWFPSGIQLSYFGSTISANPGQPCCQTWSPQSTAFQGQVLALSIPGNSQIGFGFGGHMLVVAATGQPIGTPDWGQPRILSVAPDGSTALVSYQNGSPGTDVYLVNTQGQLERLTSNGLSPKALWPI